MAVVTGHFAPSDADLVQGMLEVNHLVNQFRAIERSIEFRGVPGKERNGEHTFQVIFLGVVMNISCEARPRQLSHYDASNDARSRRGLCGRHSDVS